MSCYKGTADEMDLMLLRAAQNASGPQAVAADGERIAVAILFVFLRVFTATAIRAGGKFKFSYPLPKGCIIRLQPNRLQRLLLQTSAFKTAEKFLPTPDIAGV